MGLIRGIVGAPLAPIRGVAAVAEQVRQQAEDDFYDPDRIRRRLQEIQEMRDEGTIDEAEATAEEDELVERLLVARDRARGDA